MALSQATAGINNKHYCVFLSQTKAAKASGKAVKTMVSSSDRGRYDCCTSKIGLVDEKEMVQLCKGPWDKTMIGGTKNASETNNTVDVFG